MQPRRSGVPLNDRVSTGSTKLFHGVTRKNVESFTTKKQHIFEVVDILKSICIYTDEHTLCGTPLIL